MKKYRKILTALVLMAALICLFATPAFAVTESEVQTQVDSVGREAVTGNIFIWFLCAIAFLKVSQKIDSFMSSLGINVGHTGGSMIAEAIIAARGISAIKGVAGGGRITGTETTSEYPDGIRFGMYSADQYTAPKGDYTTVTAVDGSQWYKQYAADTVDKTPFMGADGSIGYRESITKRLPDPPRRKDKI